MILNIQISTISTDLGPFTINDGFTDVASGVSRIDLIGGIQLEVDPGATGVTVTSTAGVCEGTELVIPIEFRPCGTGPFVPTPPPPPPPPTPTPTPTPPPPTVYTYYLASPRAKTDTDSSGCVDFFDYCLSPGYFTSQPIYSNVSVVDLLLNTTVYTDVNLTIPYTGLGNDYYYAISPVLNLNTHTAGNTLYKMLVIDNTGYVLDIALNPCTCSGGGVPI